MQRQDDNARELLHKATDLLIEIVQKSEDHNLIAKVISAFIMTENTTYVSDLNTKRRHEQSHKVNSSQTNPSGTYLIGVLDVSYDKLISVLGESMSGDGYKTRCEWTIEREIDGEIVVATIYDWKQAIPVESVTRWNVGGHSHKAMDLVNQLFK
jgi:hypothetical protein